MPKKDLHNIWTALGDILREVSPVLKVTIVLGLLAGLVAGFLFIDQFTSSEARWLRQFFTLTFFGLVAAGAFAGLVLGVVIELVWNRLRRTSGRQDTTPHAVPRADSWSPRRLPQNDAAPQRPDAPRPRRPPEKH